MIKKTNAALDVSIVIVCMNNLKNLYPCLNSIKKYTKVSYEVLVVAYLFSPENLIKVKQEYPWVIFIESNEYRGFSENNNLALRQARGRYCFVQNDDTYYQMPVVDKLIESFEKTPGCAIISPTSHYPDGRYQSSGRPKLTWWTFLLTNLKLFNEQKVKSVYTKGNGVFQTYNIVGAFFLIPTDLFRQLGWFDETYFFCPEDVALSTKANKLGYKVYVDANVDIIHVEGGTWNRVKTATSPSALRGALIFYSNGNKLAYIFLSFCCLIINLLKLFAAGIMCIISTKEINKIKFRCFRNNMSIVFTRLSTKEVFIKFYSRINKKE